MSEVGEGIVAAITSQVDLLTTLAVAICGGIVALLVQIAFHNSDNEKQRVIFVWGPLLLAAFVAESLSILFGYLTYAAVTNAIPIVLQAQFEETKILAEQEFRQNALIRVVMTFQFVMFGLGIVCVFVVLLRNRSTLLGGAKQ